MPEPVADPEFPDLVGVAGGPLIPCKVVEITATMVPTVRVAGRDGMNATYEQTQRYVIRYQPKPVEITYMSGASGEEIQQAKNAVLDTALELIDEQQTPPGRLPTVIVGQEFTPEHRFVLRFYRRAHGLPTIGAVATAAEVNQAVEWWNRRQEAHD
jgi:hypothetical protein